MKTLIDVNPINHTHLQFPPPIFLFHFPSLSRQNKKFLRHISCSKLIYPLKPPILSPINSSLTTNAISYGGWEDVGLDGDSVNSGESTPLRSFLLSLGIDDKKHVFTFLLGAFLAFAIARVKVSSIVVFPASALVFAVGFSIGFVRGGNFNEFSVSAIKRKAKEETFRVYGEKLRTLVEFFDGFDSKVDNLKRAIDTKEIELSDLEEFVDAIESIKSSALSTRGVVEATIDNVDTANGVLVENQKSSRKRKENGETGFVLLQYIGSFFGEKSINSKPSKQKNKDNVKQGTLEDLESEQSRGNNSAPEMKRRVIDATDNGKGNTDTLFFQDAIGRSALDWDEEKRIRIVPENAKLNRGEMNGYVKRRNDGKRYFVNDNIEQFANDRAASRRMDQDSETEEWESNGNPHDSVDFSVRLKHIETKASFTRRQTSGKTNGTYRSSYRRNMSEDEIFNSQVGERMMNNDLDVDDYNPTADGFGPSSPISDDVLFDRHLTEANNLLKKAKDCMRGRRDEEQAEIILYKSAKLLSKAIAMKPMSLLAVGQLGNTYLLHGELKLRISRELRSLLSRRDPLSFENHSRILKGLNDQAMQKDKVASVLVDVCEECEELLVEAGRKYRMALSIDGNDARALYNWGLALSFRAQLIADIGPEAAIDADKVFLAAIDKFDAMMSKSNDFAPDALFRWGVALQHRSRLRPSNSKEKVKLLQQAKRLYEDALQMDSDNPQVREALSVCVSELNRRLL
ncbi:hypothetical protein Tsubulata_013833 [Turnera subulata]|uniref:Uncharacterized protein n=1 Tax=Turnera subulata TaxID=218843 RepID=A0A9Q0GJ08_9ROSI|nr:hypothetical protein Tsubulata_013833 [Turnera subulata]